MKLIWMKFIKNKGSLTKYMNFIHSSQYVVIRTAT